MKKLAVLVLALSLAGCVNGKAINPFASFANPATKDALAKLEAAYGAAASIALAGRNACAKRELPPICRTYVVQAQKADLYAYNQIVVARTFVKNNPTVDASVILSTAQDAVSAYQSAAQQIKGQ